MNALVPLSDLAARRSLAAHKAWATRRAQFEGRAAPRHAKTKSLRALAIEAYEREAASDNPDWHRAALRMKAAMAPAPAVIEQRGEIAKLPPPAWPDYPVNDAQNRRLQFPSPVLVVTFADGGVVRAPAVSLIGKPVNVGRGLRVAIAFYQARLCWTLGLRNRPGTRPAVPAIVACVCEDTGERYDAAECNARTAGDRAPQDWKIRGRHG